MSNTNSSPPMDSCAAPGSMVSSGASRNPPPGPIVKPLPPELFQVFGSNAEMRWEAMAGQGHLVPVDRFFVRDHTGTPLLDAGTWVAFIGAQVPAIRQILGSDRTLSQSAGATGAGPGPAQVRGRSLGLRRDTR